MNLRSVLITDEHIGVCPACKELVKQGEDGVWTCPCDLSSDNPFWSPGDARITEELRNKTGIYSNCGEDFGFPCVERMPLHAKCYDKGEY